MTARLTFVEREPYEKGFAQVFEREIAPKLHDVERERLARRRKKQQVLRSFIRHSPLSLRLKKDFSYADQ